MKLNELLTRVKPIKIIGSPDKEIIAVDIDSRKVGKDHLFVAIKGTQTDGHKFIDKAIENGAVAIVVENLPKEIHNDNITFVQV